MEVTSKTRASSTVCLREGKKGEKQQEGLDENVLRQYKNLDKFSTKSTRALTSICKASFLSGLLSLYKRKHKLLKTTIL